MKTACIDKYKAEAFAALGQTLDYYNQLGDANITLAQVYPAGEQPIALYDHAPGDTGKTYETETLIIPIAIHDPITDTLGFGTLTIKKQYPVISP